MNNDTANVVRALDDLGAVIAAAGILRDFNGPKDFSDAFDAEDELKAASVLKAHIEAWLNQ